MKGMVEAAEASGTMFAEDAEPEEEEEVEAEEFVPDQGPVKAHRVEVFGSDRAR